MNEYRTITAEEFAEIAPALERYNIFSPESVCRFVDTKLEKTYDVYLLKGETKTVLKKSGSANGDAAVYARYFETQDFAVPRILDNFTLGEASFVRMEFVDGSDARGCTPEEGGRIGRELAKIQSRYLAAGGHTEQADSYFKRNLFNRFQKIREHLQDAGKVFSYVEQRFFMAPQTLIHDDLLPINVFVQGQQVRFVDWEYAQIQPYFLDLARFAFIYDMDENLFISRETADSFLRCYYEKMREHPGFSISRKQFELDTAVSAFCQYALFLSFCQDAEKIKSSVDYRYLSRIVDYIKAEGLPCP